MSERGVFGVDRGIWDHPSFADEALTEREAWIWLIGNAAFKPHTKRVGSVVVELARGQVAASSRFMADKLGWSEPRVRRFLKRLKADAMIDAAIDADITVITICNYDKYQKVSLPPNAARDAQIGAAATQQRRKVEDKEYKESNSVPKGTGAGAPVYTDSRHELWGEAVPILVSLGVAETLARRLIGSWLKSTKDDAQVVLGAIQRARDHRAHDPIPWITNALKVPHEQTTRQSRTNSAARPPQTGDDAVVTGMARALQRRREARAAVDRGGFQGRGDVAGKPDPDGRAAASDAGAHRQLAFLPAGNDG